MYRGQGGGSEQLRIREEDGGWSEAACGVRLCTRQSRLTSSVLLIWCVQVLKSDVAAATDLLGKIVTVRPPRLCTRTSFPSAGRCRCARGVSFVRDCFLRGACVSCVWMSDSWQSPKFTDADVDAEKAAVLAEIEAVSPHPFTFRHAP